MLPQGVACWTTPRPSVCPGYARLRLLCPLPGSEAQGPNSSRVPPAGIWRKKRCQQTAPVSNRVVRVPPMRCLPPTIPNRFVLRTIHLFQTNDRPSASDWLQLTLSRARNPRSRLPLLPLPQPRAGQSFEVISQNRHSAADGTRRAGVSEASRRIRLPSSRTNAC